MLSVADEFTVQRTVSADGRLEEATGSRKNETFAAADNAVTTAHAIEALMPGHNWRDEEASEMMNRSELQATRRVSVNEGFSGRATERRPRTADRTEIIIVGVTATPDATTPAWVIGHAASMAGREQPKDLERQENGGGVDVCEGLFEGVAD